MSDIDFRIGDHLRATREQKSIALEMLAGLIGASVEELNEIERGSVRIPPKILKAASEILNEPIRAFFEDSTNSSSHRQAAALMRLLISKASSAEIEDLPCLISKFLEIGDEEKRKQVLLLVKRLSES